MQKSSFESRLMALQVTHGSQKVVTESGITQQSTIVEKKNYENTIFNDNDGAQRRNKKRHYASYENNQPHIIDPL